MKLLSIVVFSIALIWTWNIMHSSPNISFETHAGIQEKLAQLITDNLKIKKPTATDIRVEKVWTEVIGKNKVKAYFVYSFKDMATGNAVTSQISGEGVLEKQIPTANAGAETSTVSQTEKNTEKNTEQWQLSQVKTSSDVVVFEDGLVVTPGETTEENPAPATGGPVPEEAKDPKELSNKANEHKQSEPASGAIKH